MRGQPIASSGVVGSWARTPRSRRATPLVTAALATASATDSATLRLKTLGIMYRVQLGVGDDACDRLCGGEIRALR